MGKAARKELTRNPKKTVLLGLMCLVAFYFWAPLVFGVFGSGEEASEEGVAAAIDPPVMTTAGAPLEVGAPKTEPTFTWQQLTAWRQQDTFTKPASLPPEMRDPFLSSSAMSIAGGENAAEASDVRQLAAVVTPEALGMELGGTIVGRHGRVATINGRTYAQGAAVPVGGASPDETAESSDAEAEATIRFTLREVHPSHVVLEREGSVYSLLLKRPAPNQDLRIVAGG